MLFSKKLFRRLVKYANKDTQSVAFRLILETVESWSEEYDRLELQQQFCQEMSLWTEAQQVEKMKDQYDKSIVWVINLISEEFGLSWLYVYRNLLGQKSTAYSIFVSVFK
jgi:hypothetical protein